jgi:Fe-S cluster biosynthesis and repair protein YggX
MLKVRRNFVLVFTASQYKFASKAVFVENEKYIKLLENLGCVVRVNGNKYFVTYTILINEKGIALGQQYTNRFSEETMMSFLRKDIETKIEQYPDFYDWCLNLPGWSIDLRSLLKVKGYPPPVKVMLDTIVSNYYKAIDYMKNI